MLQPYNVSNNAFSRLICFLDETSEELFIEQEDEWRFPDPPFVVTIGEEVIEVRAKDGNRFYNLIRGVEGTPDIHYNRSEVELKWTAGSYDRLANSVRMFNNLIIKEGADWKGDEDV